MLKNKISRNGSCLITPSRKRTIDYDALRASLNIK